MVELKAKILIKTSQAGYGMKLASQLKKMGLDAVVRSNLKRLSDENYKVMCVDEVKRINGVINFEKAVRYQRRDE